jgi:hypothetical protein
VPLRLLASRHAACGGDTQLRLPRVLPSIAVRRVVCGGCAEAYVPERLVATDEARSSGRGLALPSLPALPSPSVSWRWLSLPVAALAVVGILLALRGGGETDTESTTSATAAAPAAAEANGNASANGASRDAKVPGDAQLISESTFQLALPAGWERTTPSSGATFAAVAPGADADVMLWVERDPKLDFATFEARSLAQLESLAGSAGVVERSPGPTPETTSIKIAPTSPPRGAPNYEVLLRSTGSYWYYLATTSQPGAAPEAVEGVALVQGSFLPQGTGR